MLWGNGWRSLTATEKSCRPQLAGSFQKAIKNSWSEKRSTRRADEMVCNAAISKLWMQCQVLQWVPAGCQEEVLISCVEYGWRDDKTLRVKSRGGTNAHRDNTTLQPVPPSHLDPFCLSPAACTGSSSHPYSAALTAPWIFNKWRFFVLVDTSSRLNSDRTDSNSAGCYSTSRWRDCIFAWYDRMVLCNQFTPANDL